MKETYFTQTFLVQKRLNYNNILIIIIKGSIIKTLSNLVSDLQISCRADNTYLHTILYSRYHKNKKYKNNTLKRKLKRWTLNELTS